MQSNDWKETTVGVAKTLKGNLIWWRPDGKLNVKDPDNDVAYYLEVSNESSESSD